MGSGRRNPAAPAYLRWLLVVVMGVTALAGGACSGDDDESGEDAAADAATVDLGPLPEDEAAARAWAAEHRERIDAFRRVAGQLAAPDLPEDCEAVAGQMEGALGPVQEHLAEVAGSPDPVLGELLTSATISARTLLAACAAEDDVAAADEREGLRNALVLIARRQAELRGDK